MAQKLAVTYAYAADITKAERDPDTGDLMVYGKATGPDLDLDGQICDPKWLKTAMPAWFQWANVREMHGAVAAGVGVELEGDDAANYMLLSRCVDKSAAEKVEKKVYKGYSIGIKNAQVVKDIKAPGGRIVGGEIVEVSYVDRPCNPTAKMAIAKGAGLAEDGETIEVEDDALTDPVDLGPVEAPETEVEPATVVEPVPTEPESAPVVEAAGADSPSKAIGRDVERRMRKLLPHLSDITKGTPAEDIDSAQEAINAIGALIVSEAQGLAAGNSAEAGQISCLLRAIDALCYFQYQEAQEGDGGAGSPVDIDYAATPDQGKIAPTSPDIAQLVKDAIAEASKAQEAEIESLRATLAKVSALPRSGGPVLARPRAVIAEAGERESTLAEVEKFERLAASMRQTDPVVADGFRQMAEKARLRLSS